MKKSLSLAGRRTNLALLAALGAALGSGALAFAVGHPSGGWAAGIHGAAGLAILLLSPWKSIIVRRGLARASRRKGASIALTVLTVIALATGLFHSSGLVLSLQAATAMQLHVGAALLAIPFALWHVRSRPGRAHRTDLSRRNALRTGALVGASALGYLGLEGFARLLGTRGASRRVTGSYERGSHDIDAMPVTQWLDDDVPLIQAAGFTLKVGGRTLSYEQLWSYEDEVRATIDCTGGWYAEQDWSGVWLDRLLQDVSGARSIRAVSATGYSRGFPLSDAPRLLLAVRAQGQPLSAGHGGPVRIVAPHRRGFWWVKWVDRIELSARPWWLQPPFPLT
ncbi:MAG TPA: molybdopterin-dependent oxidoreductase [Actinomycetota bacterium]|nr:molybdopterin-dependent oxidoreductase [Actinomycetota bacterium]